MQQRRTEARAAVRPLHYEDGRLLLLDQRRLPAERVTLACNDAAAVCEAIRALAVRGAPAIGIAAAYGVALAARQWPGDRARVEAALNALAQARPTAVNLAAALARQRRVLDRRGAEPEVLLAEAQAIEADEVEANRAMAEAGAALLAHDEGVLTVCNTGALATAGLGTALGVIRVAHAQGKISRIHACETRPWLQGARLTAWELAEEGIPVTLLVDAAAAHLMATGAVQWLIVGADRICANGDTANKIGTRQLAIAARYHGVRTMVVAPTSTIDLATDSGAAVPIEQRDPDEVLCLAGQRIAAPGALAFNPVFDITPATLIDAIVCERGIARPPFPDSLLRLLARD